MIPLDELAEDCLIWNEWDWTSEPFPKFLQDECGGSLNGKDSLFAGVRIPSAQHTSVGNL